MLNIVCICGRMVKDPELRMTQSQKSVASFTLAVDRDYVVAGEQRQTDFIDCCAFGGTADFLAKYFSRGSMVALVGRLQLRDWTDRDGNKRRAAEVVADRVYFGEAKKQETKQEYKPAGKPVDVDASGFQEMDGEDPRLPF